MIEDSPEDAEAVSRHLRRHGLQMDYHRVDNAHQFLEALATFRPGLILSEHLLRQFGAIQALQIVRRQHCPAPFIVVAADVSEKAMRECLGAGAYDLVWKGRLERLPDAVSILEFQERLSMGRSAALR